jgi:hypothetical protein
VKKSNYLSRVPCLKIDQEIETDVQNVEFYCKKEYSANTGAHALQVKKGNLGFRNKLNDWVFRCPAMLGSVD